MIALHSIPYGHQDISRADIDAVVDVLQSDWLTQGPGAADDRVESRANLDALQT